MTTDLKQEMTEQLSGQLAGSLTQQLTTQLTAQLGAWLAATDIGHLELRGPGLHLCLQNDGGFVVAVPPGTAPRAALAALPVAAASVGIYLHAHPLHEAPLVAQGQAVAAGQAIGLLQIGALLLPVVSPQDGIFRHHLVKHGSTVGYGTMLAELMPTHPA